MNLSVKNDSIWSKGNLKSVKSSSLYEIKFVELLTKLGLEFPLYETWQPNWINCKLRYWKEKEQKYF